jgi:hypothetical protein
LIRSASGLERRVPADRSSLALLAVIVIFVVVVIFVVFVIFVGANPQVPVFMTIIREEIVFIPQPDLCVGPDVDIFSKLNGVVSSSAFYPQRAADLTFQPERIIPAPQPQFCIAAHMRAILNVDGIFAIPPLYIEISIQSPR